MDLCASCKMEPDWRGDSRKELPRPHPQELLTRRMEDGPWGAGRQEQTPGAQRKTVLYRVCGLAVQIQALDLGQDTDLLETISS